MLFRSAFIQATDIEMILYEIETDTSRFYLLTYEPPSLDGAGDYHEIPVVVSRDDTDVRARCGYVHNAPDARVRRVLTAGVVALGAAPALAVEARRETARQGKGVWGSVVVDREAVIEAVAGRVAGEAPTDCLDVRVQLRILDQAVLGRGLLRHVPSNSSVVGRRPELRRSAHHRR